MIREIRRAVGNTMPISLRFSQWKQQDFGARLAHNPDELRQFLEPLAEAGVDVWNVSVRRYWEPAFAGSPLSLAEWVKKLTGIIIMTVGSAGLTTDLLHGWGDGLQRDAVGGQSMVEHMETMATARFAPVTRLLEMLEQGEFDLVQIGRSLICDPEWPLKIRGGRISDITPYDATALTTLL